jgi:hypothetical protein
MDRALWRERSRWGWQGQRNDAGIATAPQHDFAARGRSSGGEGVHKDPVIIRIRLSTACENAAAYPSAERLRFEPCSPAAKCSHKWNTPTRPMTMR